MRPIRVCQIITELRPSGAERVVYELATRLDRSRFEVHVAALRGGALEQELTAAGIGVTVLGVRGKWDWFKIGRLARLFRYGSEPYSQSDELVSPSATPLASVQGEHGGGLPLGVCPRGEESTAANSGGRGTVARRVRGTRCAYFDLVHTHLFHADLCGRVAATTAGVKRLVHTVHVAEQRWRPWQFAWARLAASRCDRIVCVSPSVLEHHRRLSGLGLSTYTVIPNGVDVPRFTRDQKARANLRRQWGLDEDTVVVAFVGRLDHQKGLDVLLDSLAMLLSRPGESAGSQAKPTRSFGWGCVIVGDGPQRGMVEAFLREHPEAPLKYLGFRQDVPAILSASDAFVLPSRWEGWPLALTEAMAAGLACVATDVAGNRDAIQSGQTGLLVESENSAALAAALDTVITDAHLRGQLGQAAATMAASNYSIEANIAAHEALYHQVVGR